MTNNLLSTTTMAAHHQENRLQPVQDFGETTEYSYRPDYSLQDAKPCHSEYASCNRREQPVSPGGNTAKRLSYAERRLRNYL